jgi:hypothetical protein
MQGLSSVTLLLMLLSVDERYQRVLIPWLCEEESAPRICVYMSVSFVVIFKVDVMNKLSEKNIKKSKTLICTCFSRHHTWSSAFIVISI